MNADERRFIAPEMCLNWRGAGSLGWRRGGRVGAGGRAKGQGLGIVEREAQVEWILVGCGRY